MTTAALLCGALCVTPAAAQEAGAYAEPPPRAAGAYADLMDPMMRAILFALAARVLREAAASPDPLGSLGDAIERSVTSAATNPRTLKTIEALTAQALKDAPPELRQALLAFIVSTLKHARRENQARSEVR